MSLFHSPSLVTSDLVLCLDAGNPKSYPGSGTTWTDLSGNGNNGTLINGPTYSSANGGAIVFDGVNDQVSVAYSSSLDTPNGATYIFWIKRTAGSNEFLSRGIADSGLNSDNPRLYHYSDNRVYIDWNNLATNDRYVNSASYVELSTNCLAFVFSPGQPFLFYANGLGISVAMSGAVSTDTTMYNNTQPIIIGCAAFNNRYFNGKINSVSLYNRALSAAEVKQNFNAMRGRYGL